LKKPIAALTEGDTLIVTRFGRLARSTCDLLNIIATIADKGAGFKSLGDEWADTIIQLRTVIGARGPEVLERYRRILQSAAYADAKQ
jgi:DNA invertase Pin-like site-specific DNA recombinase